MMSFTHRAVAAAACLVIQAALPACGSSSSDEEPGDLLLLPEGGNMLFEWVYYDTEMAAAVHLPPGVTSVNRVIAYFMNHHAPERNPMPTRGTCTNLVTTQGWPAYVSRDREDLDVGELSITGQNTAGAGVTIVATKKPMGIDSIGRAHDVWYDATNLKGEDFLKANSSYTVQFGGAGVVPPTTFPDALFLAEDFTISSPDLEDNGPLAAGTDFTVHWSTTPSSNLPAGDEVLGVTWLMDSHGVPTHMCPELRSAGKFTISGSTIAEYKALATARGTNPNKVILLRNAIVHKVSPLPNGDPENPRRIDMMTVFCWAQLMDVL